MKRYLKPQIEKILIGLTTICLGFLLLIHDFEMCWQTISIIGSLLFIVINNMYILSKYGRLFKDE